MSDCGCKPGTPGEGWQERRSPACEHAEMVAWRRLFQLAHEIGESFDGKESE